MQFLPLLEINALYPFSAHHARASISRSLPKRRLRLTNALRNGCASIIAASGGDGSVQSITKISVLLVCRESSGGGELGEAKTTEEKVWREKL